MEEMMKLRQFLQNMGFKLTVLGLLQFFLFSCKTEWISEFSFHNRLDYDVELFLYMHEEAFDGKVNHKYLIEKDAIVKFIQLSTKDKGGFDNSVFCSQIDSAKLKISDIDDYVAIWRASQEPQYALGYEMKWDFLCEWTEIIQHGGTHAERVYVLELSDE